MSSFRFLIKNIIARNYSTPRIQSYTPLKPINPTASPCIARHCTANINLDTAPSGGRSGDTEDVDDSDGHHHHPKSCELPFLQQSSLFPSRVACCGWMRMPIPIILFFPLLSHPILVSGATGPCNGMVCALCLGVDTFGLVNLEQQSNIWTRNLIECIQPRGASSVRKCGQPLPNANGACKLAKKSAAWESRKVEDQR